MQPRGADDAVQMADGRILVRPFRGEERLEDALLHRGAHALPRVSHAQQDLLPLGPRVRPRSLVARGDEARLDQQPPATLHRVASVDAQVHEHLLDLPWSRRDLQRALARPPRELDVFRDQSPQHLQEVLDESAQFDGCFWRRVA
jgi:hypothetical protein